MNSDQAAQIISQGALGRAFTETRERELNKLGMRVIPKTKGLIKIAGILIKPRNTFKAK
jgi:hypothetical protein